MRATWTCGRGRLPARGRCPSSHVLALAALQLAEGPLPLSAGRPPLGGPPGATCPPPLSNRAQPALLVAAEGAQRRRLPQRRLQQPRPHLRPLSMRRLLSRCRSGGPARASVTPPTAHCHPSLLPRRNRMAPQPSAHTGLPSQRVGHQPCTRLTTSLHTHASPWGPVASAAGWLTAVPGWRWLAGGLQPASSWCGPQARLPHMRFSRARPSLMLPAQRVA